MVYYLTTLAFLFQLITDKPVGTFFRLPTGDEVSTITRQLPAKVPALRKDAFEHVFKTTETFLTTITLIKTHALPSTETVTTTPLYILRLRRMALTTYTLRLKPDYFFDTDGKLYRRTEP